MLELLRMIVIAILVRSECAEVCAAAVQTFTLQSLFVQ